VLICEDEATTRELLGAVLSQAGYKVTLCESAEETSAHIQSKGWPALAVIDVNLPGENGLDLCQKLQKFHPRKHFPVIVMTAAHNPTTERNAFLAGACDFLHKPFAMESLLQRVRTHLELAHQRHILHNQVEEKTLHITGLQRVITFALTTLCSQRDLETGKHIVRTQLYAQTLAQEVAHKNPHLSKEKIALIFRHAPLHDIGKIAVPDRILLKPGKLTTEEFAVIQRHPETGHRALQSAESQSKIALQELEVAKNIILFHHERWDGKGYPNGLEQEGIPIEARIMSICDVYDALRSKRVYKPAFDHEKASQIILEGKGTQFDPEIVAAFLECEESFQNISEALADSEEEFLEKSALLA
jgi:putative two-component system response regulator